MGRKRTIRGRHPLRRVVDTEPNWTKKRGQPWSYTDQRGIEVLECGHRLPRRSRGKGTKNAQKRRCWKCTKHLVAWPCLKHLSHVRHVKVTVPQDPSQRVIVFIDGGNAYQTFRTAYGTGRYDPATLSRRLAGIRQLVEWRFYAGIVPEGLNDRRDAQRDAQQRFFTAIRKHPDGRLCLGRMQVVNGGEAIRGKGVDVQLAIDMVRLAFEDQYDVAILLSCDEDLLPAVDVVQQRFSKVVELAIPENARAFHMCWLSEQIQRITPGMFREARSDIPPSVNQ